MTLTQLEIFVAVADRQSFTGAALALGIGQSAVSHAIRALEQEWGVSLFQRQEKPLAPTPVGARLLARARAMLGLSATMAAEAADARGLSQGSLHLGSFGPSASLHLLPPLLSAYQARYPGIEIHLDEGTDGEVKHWLQSRRVDLGVVCLPERAFDTLPLGEDQMVALLPPAHPLGQHPALPLAALCDDPFILTGAGSGDLVSALFQARGLTPRVRFRPGQLITTLDLVARGEGVAVVAELALPRGTAASYQVRPLSPAVPRRVGLAARSVAELAPPARAFWALLDNRGGGLRPAGAPA